jgi:hypothetical protein
MLYDISCFVGFEEEEIGLYIGNLNSRFYKSLHNSNNNR